MTSRKQFTKHLVTSQTSTTVHVRDLAKWQLFQIAFPFSRCSHASPLSLDFLRSLPTCSGLRFTYSTLKRDLTGGSIFFDSSVNIWNIYFYRPQRSWGKVIFSQESVILFTWGDGGVWSWGVWSWGGSACSGRVPAPGGLVLGWPALGDVCSGGQVSRPTPKGEVEGNQIQVHTKGRNWGGLGPGPHPRGQLRGIRSRRTPKGEVEGDLVQVHTPGGSWGDLVQVHTKGGS